MRIASIPSYGVTSNSNLECKRKQNPNFGRIDFVGEIGIKLTEAASKKGLLGKYGKHTEELLDAGMNTSKIVYRELASGDVCVDLVNPSISNEYESPLFRTDKHNLIEKWLKLKPEDIKNAEKSIKTSVQNIYNLLIKKALYSDDVYDTVMKKHNPLNSKSLSEVISHMPEAKVIEVCTDAPLLEEIERNAKLADKV